jgi:ABC-type proline/glycine betaine transport system substrate-binding protein
MLGNTLRNTLAAFATICAAETFANNWLINVASAEERPEPSATTATLTGVLVTASLGPQKQCAIAVAEFPWPVARLMSLLLERLLHDGAACDVSRLPADPKRTRLAFENDASNLAAPAITAPLDWLSSLGESKKNVRISAPLFGGGERVGFFMSAWVEEKAPEIVDLIAASRRPDLFARNARRKPLIHLCPSTWRCHQEGLAALSAMGLVEAFEIEIPASGDALIESVHTAARQGRAWLGYLWTPSAIAAEHPLVPMALGSVQLCDDASGALECRAPFPIDYAVTVYSPDIEDNFPHAAAILRRFSIPSKIAMEALFWKSANNASDAETVDYVFSAHSGLWSEILDAQGRIAFAIALRARLSKSDG